MNFSNLLTVALSAIKRNRLRSFLTMLGIIIGVGSVITMLAIGEGSNQNIKSTISSMGTNLITVMPTSKSSGGIQMGRSVSQSLKLPDVDFIRNNSSEVESISPEIKGSGQIILGTNNWPTSMYGGNQEYTYIKKYEVALGRIYTEQEIKRAAKVCLVGQTVVDNIFDADVDPIGQTIRFNNIPLQIIGILSEKGNNTFGQDQDDMILIPYTTAMKRITRQTHLNDIVLSAKSEDRIDIASAQIEESLRIAHKITNSEDDDFELRTQQDLVESFGSISEMMIILLGAISGISLLVGGIGIMNIMYVSVTERTREIGLRLAIGGKGSSILMQFLLEAILLSVIGGIIGIVAGLSVSHFVANMLGWPILITTSSVVMSSLFCTIIGVFFGWYPAKKASGLNPIEALRHE